jgi:hypothetical protein
MKLPICLLPQLKLRKKGRINSGCWVDGTTDAEALAAFFWLQSTDSLHQFVADSGRLRPVPVSLKQTLEWPVSGKAEIWARKRQGCISSGISNKFVSVLLLGSGLELQLNGLRILGGYTSHFGATRNFP